MTSSSNSNFYIQQPSIPLFHGENYDFWAIKMKTLFMSQDVWEIVQNGYDEVEDTSTLEQPQKYLLKESRKKNTKAFMYIQQGVGDTILPKVIHFPIAKEAWNILQQEYGGDKKVRELKLHSYRRDFENLKMNENECLNEFSSRVVEVVNNMMMCGKMMEERRICEKILICLPEKFEPFLVVLEETKDFSTLKSQELWASLKVYEQRLLRHSEKSIEIAFQSKLSLNSKNSATNKNEYKGESTSHFKGKGKWKKGGANSNNYTKSDSSQSEAWFIDSGCTTHMSSVKSLFVDMDTSINSLVKMGDGNMVQANGRGTICVQTINGAKYIRDVLYVPDLAQNLLSVGQLVELGYAVNFEDGYCTIYDKKHNNKRQVMKSIKMEKNRSFPIIFEKEKNVPLRMETIDETWL
ncbi:uncharacterized protein LOC113312660 [Papaver somniferum]|uniref:uncharacterized protein LOC113312660 n=1 Tax=Papaver somniferum TaxID=3469 RepID=UPI000E6F4B1B|nr:uncharacterized protein LOC113312660 [Papaver somniferum]